MHIRPLALLALAALACQTTGAQTPTDPKPRACPTEVPAGAVCHTGEDGLGGFYWIALPAQCFASDLTPIRPCSMLRNVAAIGGPCVF